MKISQRRLSGPLVPSVGVSDTTNLGVLKTGRVPLSKVPAVTLWFWIIKILCTTVGESFADWLSVTQGMGLPTTALISTVALLRSSDGSCTSATTYLAFIG